LYHERPTRGSGHQETEVKSIETIDLKLVLADLFCFFVEFIRFQIAEKDFNDFFGVQFHGAQQKKRYLLHVEAKIKSLIDELLTGNE